MTLTTARLHLRANVLNGLDSSAYSNTSVDLAITAIGNRVVEEAKPTRSIDTVDLSQDAESVDFTDLSGFLPEFLIDFGARIKSEPFATATVSGGVITAIAINYSLIYDAAPDVVISGGNGTGATATCSLTDGRVTSFTVTDGGSGYTDASTISIELDGDAFNFSPTDDDLSPLRIVDIGEISRSKLREGTSSGVPRLLAFEIEGNAIESAVVWPPPKSDGVIEVCWYPPFTAFTAGTGSPDSVTLNVRDSLLIEALRCGGPAYLQASEPEHASAVALSEQKLAAWIARIAGRGGDKSFQRLGKREASRTGSYGGATRAIWGA